MPIAPYVSAAEAKAWLGIPTADASQDQAVDAAIAAASAMIQKHLGFDIGPGQSTEQVFGLGASYLYPRRTPIGAVASVTRDGEAVPFTFDTFAIRRTDGRLFERHAAYVVTYSVTEELPKDVVLAAKMTVQAVFGAPAMDPNLLGESNAGFGSSSYQPGGPGSLPRSAASLLEEYRRRF
jgi:hypothetical protein